MSKNATQDLAQGLAHDLRDVADDIRSIVGTVVVPKVGTAVQAAAERVPDSVVDRLPASVADHLPVQRRGRGRKLLLVGGLAALGAAALAFARRSQSAAPAPAPARPASYPRPVVGENNSSSDALDDPLTDPLADPAHRRD